MATLILSVTSAFAQVKVVVKPAPQVGPDEFVVYDQWVMSWGLRHDPPDEYTMGIRTFKTREAAIAAGNAAIARTARNGDWAITHVLIEGEPSIRSKKGPTLPTADRLERDAAEKIGTQKDPDRGDVDNPILSDDPKDKLFYDVFKKLNKILTKDVLDAIKGKNQTVQSAYDRAKEAKELLVRNVEKIAEDDVKKVNGLIAEYNSLADKYSKEQPGGEYFAALPRMTPVSVNSNAMAKAWGAAATSQSELEEERKKLDEERIWLEKERAALVDEGRSLEGNADAASQEVAELEGQSGGTPLLAGTSWRPETDRGWWRYEFTGGERDGEVTRSPGENNIDSATAHGKWTLTDAKTIVIQLDPSGRPGYSSYAPGQRIDVKIVGRNRLLVNGDPYGGGAIEFKPSAESGAITEKLKTAKENQASIQQKQADRQNRVKEYQRRLSAYEELLQQFEQKNAKYASDLRQLQNSAYVPGKGR